MIEFIIIAAIILVAIILFLVLAKFIGIWIRARVSNAPVGLINLVAMWIRKVPPALIVDSRITAAKAGLEVSTDLLEAHYLAGGDVENVVLSLIAADKAAIPLTYDRACAIDLAVKGTTKTVLEAVRTSINPAVIDCPGEGKKIEAVARDGIQCTQRTGARFPLEWQRLAAVGPRHRGGGQQGLVGGSRRPVLGRADRRHRRARK